jgi:putative addiction module killer protein
MPAIFTTKTFDLWFEELKDTKGRFRIQARIDRAELGNFGDCEPVGGGVSEMRIHFGPGYRIYLAQRGTQIIILLVGGDKGSQAKDIKAAIKLNREMKDLS